MLPQGPLLARLIEIFPQEQGCPLVVSILVSLCAFGRYQRLVGAASAGTTRPVGCASLSAGSTWGWMAAERTKQIFLAAGLLGGALLGASRNGLAAQEAAYQSLPVDRDLKAHAVTVGNVVNGLVSLDDHRPQLEAFFQNYLFPEIMEFDAKHVGEIAKRRVRAQSRYIDVIQNSATRDYVNKLTLRYMTKLVANRFHPAVRINAALMIGSLNAKGPTGARTNATPPVPIPEAWTFLLKIVELEKFKSGDIPDAVKVASLVGVARHARYELSLEQSQAASKVLLNILTTSQIPPGRTMEGHAWLRRRAKSTSNYFDRLYLLCQF